MSYDKVLETISADNILFFYVKAYVMGTHWNCLQAVPMNIHNILFREELDKIFLHVSLETFMTQCGLCILLLFWLLYAVFYPVYLTIIILGIS